MTSTAQAQKIRTFTWKPIVRSDGAFGRADAPVEIQVEYVEGRGGTAVEAVATLFTDPILSQKLREDLAEADLGQSNTLAATLDPVDSEGRRTNVQVSITFPKGASGALTHAVGKMLADKRAGMPFEATIRSLAEGGDDEARKTRARLRAELGW